MKKIVIKLLVFVFVFLGTAYCVLGTSYAQDFDSERAYSDYVFTRSQYDEGYRKYEVAKEAYLKNPTLTLKEEARVATIEMLRQRDDLHRVYLTAIRTKVSEVKGLTNDEKGNLFTKLDSEVLYYQGHRLTYTGNETLSEVFGINSVTEDHYKKVTLPFIYESLFMISYGQEVKIREDHQTVYQGLIDFLNSQVAEGKLIIDPFNRWFLDISATIDTLQKNELSAKTLIQKLYSENYNLAGSYRKATYVLTESVTTLNRLNNFISELATAINNQI